MDKHDSLHAVIKAVEGQPSMIAATNLLRSAVVLYMRGQREANKSSSMRDFQLFAGAAYGLMEEAIRKAPQ